MVWSGVRRERWWRGHQCGLFRWLNAHVQAGREECLVRTYRRARGTVYRETSREERVSPAPRNERCGRLARWSLALAVGAARPPEAPALLFRFRFASAPAARVSGHGVLHSPEGGLGLWARPGCVAAAAQGLPVPRKATGAATVARR